MSRARILAVDDQLYFRVFLEDALGSEGYDVVTAGSAPEALELLGQDCFDVVLTDLVMPEVDGRELVQRIRERWPDQEIVVVTSVGDVGTAVEAMKLGANDYLLKPIDRPSLVRAVEALLERRRMRQQHERLMAENLEFMGAFTLYERALGLFANLSPESLADRIVEVLCLETNAHGGILWLAGSGASGRLRLAGVRGLVRVESEVEELVVASLPEELRPLSEAGSGCFLAPCMQADATRAALFVPLRHAGRLLGVVRLTDRLDGGEFDAADRQVGDRFAPYGAQALANALRFRALERRSFRDPATGAYNQAYFEDVTRNEIRKASRFGRQFSLVRVVLDAASALRARMPADEFARWQRSIVGQVAGVARATDLLALEGESQLCLLLPETDPLGAAVLKRRLRSTLERCVALRDLEPEDRPTPFLGAASFPTDGSDVASLGAALDHRIDEDRRSLVRALDLETAPFRGLLDALLADAKPAPAKTADQMARFVLSDIARRPHERGMLFVAPGSSSPEGLREGLAALRDVDTGTEIVVLSDRREDVPEGVRVTFASPTRAGTTSPFLVYYGEGPTYAVLQDAEDGGETTASFQTSDPVLVEQLAFQLGRDLGIPISV